LRFILVDRILEMVPGESIRALKTISSNEEYFNDHFPGFPVVPGVLLTEMMAQAAGLCLDAERKARGKPMLARIKSASFRGWVEPGQDVTIYANITANRNQYAEAECHIDAAGRKVCQAELFFSFIPLQKFSPGYVNEVLEAYLASSK
jgi:3-hydroxyacyl-[acyl-carrier-protein] dehydratase